MEVVERIVTPDDLLALERPQHQDHRVDLADPGEEAVAEALARRRPGDQPGDIDQLHRRVHDLLRLRHLGQRVEATIGDARDAHVGFRGRERVGGHEGVAAREGIEQG